VTDRADIAGVTVVGTGRAGAPPDVVRIDLAAEAGAVAVQSALADATAGLANMREALTSAGVPATDLRTTDTAVHVDHGSGGRPQGYVARLGLSATVRDVAAAGTVVQDVLARGGETARLSGLSFSHSDPTGLLSTAREAAFADARAKAETYASLSGRALGEVSAVEETGGGAVPILRSMAMEASAADFAVEGGVQEVSVSVVVRWSWA
jgi:hypothetical protein